eukprot:128306-Chlamydomonas_euryale.AAC.1
MTPFAQLPLLDGELESWQLSLIFDVSSDVVGSLSNGPPTGLLLPQSHDASVERHPGVVQLLQLNQ